MLYTINDGSQCDILANDLVTIVDGILPTQLDVHLKVSSIGGAQPIIHTLPEDSLPVDVAVDASLITSVYRKIST